MNFTHTEEHEMLRDTVRKFADKELRPIAAQVDKDHAVPPAVIAKAAELGFLGVPFPEEYDGMAMGELGYCLLIEEIARGCISTAIVIGGHVSIGVTSIYLDGSEELKQKYLPALCRGEKLAAFALTEPGAGSDAGAIATTARPDGTYYVLDGMKTFITNGPVAEVFTVFAATDKSKGTKGGITAFVVEADWEGFSRGKPEDKLGICGSQTSDLIFEGLRVPKENVLGQIGEGFKVAMRTLDYGRLSLAAQCVGGAKEVLNRSIQYAGERVQFGKPIARQQLIQAMLADMAAEIYNMESITYRTAWMADQGMRFSREAAITKMYTAEAFWRIADQGVQIFGGYGYMKDYPMERYLRDSRIYRIFEGTNEIQRIIIAADLIGKGGY
ncbi:MAG: acyl-CoA dehydrogenase family protein [bacterium]